MQRQAQVSRWAVVSSLAAPVLLVGGWTLAASRQPSGFDPTEDTISALAAYGATDRWLMSLALGGVGICHLVTAAGLRPAAIPGRLMLAAGGVGTVAVASSPLPVEGTSTVHGIAACAAFFSLAAWPTLAWRSGAAPWPVRPPVSLVAGAALLALDGWFVAALLAGDRIGLAERIAAGAQALWPLVVAAGCRVGVGLTSRR